VESINRRLDMMDELEQKIADAIRKVILEAIDSKHKIPSGVFFQVKGSFFRGENDVIGIVVGAKKED
jgi:hypothetical protein